MRRDALGTRTDNSRFWLDRERSFDAAKERQKLPPPWASWFLRNLSILIALVATQSAWLASCPHVHEAAGVHPLGDHQPLRAALLRQHDVAGQRLRLGPRRRDRRRPAAYVHCADAIRRKGIKDGNGLLPYRDIMLGPSTPRMKSVVHDLEAQGPAWTTRLIRREEPLRPG